MWRMSIGGAERAVYQLIREQVRRGVQADLLVATVAGPYGERLRADGGRVIELGARSAFDVAPQWHLATIAQEYSIVHFHVQEPALIFAAAHGGRPRMVYTHRGGVRRLTPVKRVRHHIVAPFLKRRFDAITANTLQSARAISSLLALEPDSVTVLYNGIDVALLRPERSRDEVLADLPASARTRQLVGTAANLQKWKRVDRLLMAFSLLERGPLHLVVLGNGPARPQLEAMARALGVDERVTFLGTVDHVGDYLQCFDLFVLPSGPEEAFGNAAVEAMAVGIPTIVFSDGGGLTEHIVHERTGLIARDVTHLAGLMGELQQRADLRESLGAAGADYVRTAYSLGAMFDGYEALYDRVLGQDARGSSRRRG